MKTVLWICALLLLASPVNAEEPRLEFRGVRLGMSRDEFIIFYLDKKWKFVSDNQSTSDDVIFLLINEEKFTPEELEKYSTVVTAGVEFPKAYHWDCMMVAFKKDRVASVTVLSPEKETGEDWISAAEKALTEKYGKSSGKDEMGFNSGGNTTTYAGWDLGESTIVLGEFTASHFGTRSTILYLDKAVADREKADQEAVKSGL